MDPKSDWTMNAKLDKNGNYTYVVVYSANGESNKIDENQQEQRAWSMAQDAIVKAMRK